MGERTRREDHVARLTNRIRRLVTATPEIAEPIRGIVVEAAGGIQYVLVVLRRDGLATLLAVRPVAQLVSRATLHWRHRLTVLGFLTPRVFLLEKKCFTHRYIH